MSPILRLLQLTLIFDDVDRSDLIFFGLSLILGYAALCSLFVAFMVRFDANNGDETVYHFTASLYPHVFSFLSPPLF